MELNKNNIDSINATGLVKPEAAHLTLPEKVLQFGTGVLLRGLIDFYIDKANKQNIFNGRVVVVKSTASSGADAFDKQDGLFTHLIKGFVDGNAVEETVINASISRVLAASAQWNEILKTVKNEELQVIVSNTTEVGITLQKDDNIHGVPPQSFPGKLLAVLLHRYKTFNGDSNKGFVILPTELITDNATKLKQIVNELAVINNLDADFISWMNNANHFCNTLVDRIVPGKLPAEQHAETEQQLGYTDELMIMSEVFSLFAIESSSEVVKQKLSFAKADDGIIIADNIEKFRELKLRLLNASHTITCGLACLSGFNTVKEAMQHNAFATFISDTMVQEIIPSIVSDNISQQEAETFAVKVLDRFRNPYLEHQWLSITMQYSGKLRMRVMQLVINYYKKFNAVPQHIAIGFAAYLLFVKNENNAYTITDEKADYVKNILVENNSIADAVNKLFTDETLWGQDFSIIPNFADAVVKYYNEMLESGAKAVLENTSLYQEVN